MPSLYYSINIAARIVIYALIFVTLFGCAGSKTTPSTSSTSSPTPQPRNPSSTTITVQNGQDKPLALAKVVISSSVDANNEPNGTIYGTQMTGPSGQVTFHDLPTIGQVCATASERFYTTVAVCKDPFTTAETIVLP